MENEKEEKVSNLIDDIKKYCEQVAYCEDLFELQRELTFSEKDENCLVGIRLIKSALYDASFISVAKLVSDKGNYEYY